MSRRFAFYRIWDGVCGTCRKDFRRRSPRRPVYCSYACLGKAYNRVLYERGNSVAAIVKQQLYEAQDGKCAVCRKAAPRDGRKGLQVDHAPRNGRLRGLICGRCNHILRLLKDDPILVRLIVLYLRGGGYDVRQAPKTADGSYPARRRRKAQPMPSAETGAADEGGEMGGIEQAARNAADDE